MDFKVIYKDTFLEDLERILRAVALHNPTAAQKLGETILQLSDSLSFFPERHPRVRQRPGIRRFIAKRYFKIFYRINAESHTVEILRCWDGRQGTIPGSAEF